MKISIKSTLFAAAFFATISFVGCKSDSPKSTATKFLNDLYHMDYEGAKSVATDETKSMLDMLSQFSTMMPDSVKASAKKITVTIKDEKKLTDSTAEVTYTTSENKTEQKLNLVQRTIKEGGKEEKKWLAQWSKMDNSGQTNEPTEPVTEPTNDTAAVPAESAPADTTVK